MAREVRFAGCATLFRRCEALQLLEPVEDDLELRRRSVGHHRKALAIERDIIVTTKPVTASVEGLLVELGGS